MVADSAGLAAHPDSLGSRNERRQIGFRVADPADDRILLVIGWGHMRVLKQILELTPQLCPVDPVPYLSAEGD